MNLARLGNKYLAETEPWKLAKTDMERVATIMNVALQIAANISVAFEPFLPFSAAKIRRILHMDSCQWDMFGNDSLLEAGQEVAEPELIFEKIEDDVIEAQMKRLEEIKEANKRNNWQAHRCARI